MSGAVPYETVPDWARAFDIAIMPYFQDAFSGQPAQDARVIWPRAAPWFPSLCRRWSASAAASWRASNEEFLAQLERELAADETRALARIERATGAKCAPPVGGPR